MSNTIREQLSYHEKGVYVDSGEMELTDWKARLDRFEDKFSGYFLVNPTSVDRSYYEYVKNLMKNKIEWIKVELEFAEELKENPRTANAVNALLAERAEDNKTTQQRLDEQLAKAKIAEVPKDYYEDLTKRTAATINAISPSLPAHMIQVDGQSIPVENFSSTVQSLFSLMLRNRNDLNDLQYQAAIKQAAERTLQTEIARQVKTELESKKAS